MNINKYKKQDRKIKEKFFVDYSLTPQYKKIISMMRSDQMINPRSANEQIMNGQLTGELSKNIMSENSIKEFIKSLFFTFYDFDLFKKENWFNDPKKNFLDLSQNEISALHITLKKFSKEKLNYAYATPSPNEAILCYNINDDDFENMTQLCENKSGEIFDVYCYEIDNFVKMTFKCEIIKQNIDIKNKSSPYIFTLKWIICNNGKETKIDEQLSITDFHIPIFNSYLVGFIVSERYIILKNKHDFCKIKELIILANDIFAYNMKVMRMFFKTQKK